MRYVLTIWERRGERASRAQAESRAVYSEMLGFAQKLASRGQLVVAESLAPDSAGIRVNLRGAAEQVRDGPFVETKEMLGGFFTIECPDLESALSIARECPAARFATVEVRACAPCYES